MEALLVRAPIRVKKAENGMGLGIPTAMPVKLADTKVERSQGSSSIDLEALKRKMHQAEIQMARVIVQGTDKSFKFVGMDGRANSRIGVVAPDDVEPVDFDSENSEKDSIQSGSSHSATSLVIEKPDRAQISIRRDGVVLPNRRSFRSKSLQQFLNQQQRNNELWQH